MAEKPMTKTEARSWLKRIRDDLRWAEDALQAGDADDFHNAVMDASGAAAELQGVLEPWTAGDEPRGIRGLS